MTRRRFAITAGIAVPAVAVTLGARAAHQATPPTAASPEASPGASPEASPMASPAAGGDEIVIDAIDIDYDPKEFSIPADTDVSVTIDNVGFIPHDFVIDELSVATAMLSGGQSETVVINAPAGEYEYYCSVPGHREAGMVGTLTVS